MYFLEQKYPFIFLIAFLIFLNGRTEHIPSHLSDDIILIPIGCHSSQPRYNLKHLEVAERVYMATLKLEPESPTHSILAAVSNL